MKSSNIMKINRNLFLLSFLMLLQRCGAYLERNEFWVHDLNTLDSEKQMHRLADLMRLNLERVDSKFKEVMRIKSEYIPDIDQRKSFEKGYVMGDIIETYRKALVFTKKQMNKQRFLESDRIRYLSYVQKAYLKVYHLTHMMHEVDPKFGTDNTGLISKSNLDQMHHVDTRPHWNTSGFYYTKELDAIRDARVKERQQKVDREKRLRLDELAVHGTVKPGTIKTTTNWWPLAYGWDIDYYW